MLSREEIKATCEQGPEAVISLVEGLVATFQQQIEEAARAGELQDRLALNSRNSSKPPSSNTPAQRTKSLRTRSGKKPGAQQGHPGTTLKASPTPDRIVAHGPATCHDCGQNLSQVAGPETDDRRQVFDLPPLKLEVTEHRLLEQVCPNCGTLNCGAEATQEIGILPEFTGRAIHDAWSPYFNYACAHGLCNAHHLRELTFVHEQMGQTWGKDLKDLLIKIKETVEQVGERGATALAKAQQRRFENACDQVIAAGLQLSENQAPPPNGKRGRPKQSKAKNLLDRLSQRKGETLAFTTSESRSTTIKPSATCGWSKSGRRFRVASDQVAARRRSVAFAVISQRSKNKAAMCWRL